MAALDIMLDESGSAYFGRKGRAMNTDIGKVLYVGNHLSRASLHKIHAFVEKCVETRAISVQECIKNVRLSALRNQDWPNYERLFQEDTTCRFALENECLSYTLFRMEVS